MPPSVPQVAQGLPRWQSTQTTVDVSQKQVDHAVYVVAHELGLLLLELLLPFMYFVIAVMGSSSPHWACRTKVTLGV